ncbi:hypothetical protein [Zavarzinia sp.]|uniref:hypothetical protein n=1 Tax=Zavarzinia sp. TaxID=2027920 RepID=UPI0035617A54
MAAARARAIALGAVSLGQLLTTSGFAAIIPQLKTEHWNQLQRYLDAAVVDPAVQNEANAAYRKGTKVYGQLVVTDPATTRKVDRMMRDYIPLGRLDDTIRLDTGKTLSAQALAPATDNPDEAEYLDDVRKMIDRYGIWLRLAQKRVRDPEDPSRWILDGKHFEVWLSLGSRGDAIPTKTGIVDREALLLTQIIGANYWTKVDRGPVQSALDRQVAILRTEIEAGMDLHIDMAKIRRQAMAGVVEVSDFLGGADFPDIDIWDGPNKLLISAMNTKNAGRVWGARMLLIVAAIATRNAASLLNTYIAKATTGAARSVKVLKVARTAGKVAEVGLAIASGVALVTGGAGAGGIAATDAAVDAAAERELAKYLARNPGLRSEIESVRYVPGPKGTILGNMKGGHSAGYGTGFHKY